MAYGQDDMEKATRLAERDIREYLQTTPDWPDLSGQKLHLLTSFELLALVDLNRGDPQASLDRYQNAMLIPEKLSWRNFDARAIRAAVMYAILHRYTGQTEEGDRLLRELLSRISEAPIRGESGKGFTEFTIYAFLGETDAAIEALQAAVNDGWVLGWWSLEHGAFDENYAAVLEDPRFERLYDQIVSRVTEMRESFRSNPDLPQELLLEAGLATPLAAQ